MSAYFEPATEDVLLMARQIIAEWHPHLKQARIGFIFRSEAQTSKGREVLGQASKVADKTRVLLKMDFIIWLARDYWDEQPEDKRRALMDHELCHCGLDMDAAQWTTRDHDVQEFTTIIQRHGLWYPALERLAKAVQAALPGMDVAGGAVVTSATLARAAQAEMKEFAAEVGMQS